MLGSDLLLGFVLAKLFGGSKDATTASPRHVQPRNGHGGGHSRALPPAPAHPSSAPAAPSSSATPFPADVDVPHTSSAPPPPDFLQAVEVWTVRPDVIALQSHPAVTGQIGEVNDATALHALEASFPAGWTPAKRVTAQEQQTAIDLTKKPKWHDGGIVFMGPQTLSERRAYRMTKHPRGAAEKQPAPIPVPSKPGVTVPATTPVTPAPASSAPPPGFDPISREPGSAPAPSSAQAIVTVQKGEGLASIAKRLGQPATATSAKALRDANVPNGPDGHTWQATSLTDPTTRGIKRTDRKGGLQPGDRLFVPTAWGTL